MKKIIALIILACFLLPQFAFAGAWTLPRGDVWAEYTIKSNWAKSAYDSDWNRKRFERNARSWGWNQAGKIEYGLLDWITLLAGCEWKESTWKEKDRPVDWNSYSHTSNGMTTGEVGTRIRFIKDPLIVSGQVKYIFYTGCGYNEVPSLSDGADAWEFRLMAGKLFEPTVFGSKLPTYLAGEIGYGFKNRGVANYVPFLVEGGFWPTKWLLIKTELDGYWGHDGTGRDEKDYVIWRIGPVFQLLDIYEEITGKSANAPTGPAGSNITRDNNSLNLEVQYGNMIWGRNVSATQEVVLKISTQF